MSSLIARAMNERTRAREVAERRALALKKLAKVFGTNGGDTDDGSLRREEGSGGRNNVSDKTLQQREEISRLNSIGARPWAPRGAPREPCDGRRHPERIRGRIEPFESIAHPGFRSDRASRGARLRLRDYLVSNCG